MSTRTVGSIPQSLDGHGVYRVGAGRLTLDLIVNVFHRGATPEEIAQEFPSL